MVSINIATKLVLFTDRHTDEYDSKVCFVATFILISLSMKRNEGHGVCIEFQWSK